MLISTAALNRFPSRSAIPIILAITAVAIVPAVLLLRRKVRSGQWKDADASHPSERTELLRGSLLIAAVTTIALMLTPHLQRMGRGAIAALLIFAVAAIANRWMRISLHVAFAMLFLFAMSAFLRVEAAAALIVLPIVVAWARLELRRHTPIEIVLGFILGTIAGAWLRFF